MNKFFGGLFDCVKRKKGYFIFLIMLSVVAIVLGVIAAINFGGGIFAVDLSNIAYIKFLKGDSGFMSMIFGIYFSLLVFFVMVWVFHCKSYLLPFGVLFYLYLVYSQVVIFMSVILIYGILNCIILVLLMFIYFIFIWLIFLMIICDISCFTNSYNYFRCCCDFKQSKCLIFLLFLLILSIIFSFVLLILKNFVVLLIF